MIIGSISNCFYITYNSPINSNELAASKKLPSNMNIANAAFITSTGLIHTDIITSPLRMKLLLSMPTSLSLS